jgi:hypothetical protein
MDGRPPSARELHLLDRIEELERLAARQASSLELLIEAVGMTAHQHHPYDTRVEDAARKIRRAAHALGREAEVTVETRTGGH